MALLTILHLTNYIYISFLDNGKNAIRETRVLNGNVIGSLDFVLVQFVMKIFQFDKLHHCGSKKVNYLSAQLIVIGFYSSYQSKRI